MSAIYSLVFYPYEMVEDIRQLKKQLEKEIGWYNSVNSEAHITINEFEADEEGLETVRSYLSRLVSGLQPKEITFKGWGTFSSGAFFLVPDDASTVYMKKIMLALHEEFPLKTRVRSTEPHLSVARRLESKRLHMAVKMFETIESNFRFCCDGITIRRFNDERKQFGVIRKVDFKPEESRGLNEGMQLQL